MAILFSVSNSFNIWSLWESVSSVLCFSLFSFMLPCFPVCLVISLQVALKVNKRITVHFFYLLFRLNIFLEFCLPILLMISTCQSVQLLSRVRLFAALWTAACQAFLSITNSQSLLKLMSIESVMPSNHLILCRPLFLCVYHINIWR